MDLKDTPEQMSLLNNDLLYKKPFAVQFLKLPFDETLCK